MAGTRERRRAEQTAAILDVARRHLREHGAAALSLRAVARDLGVASSAVYRYVPSRDDLLTTLVVEAYGLVGEAAETAVAEARAAGADPRAAWCALWRAVRTWGLEHPAQWGLVYGTPVPGYVAPQDTVPAAARLGLAMADVVVAHAAGGNAPPNAPPDAPPGVPLVHPGIVPGLPEHLAPAVVDAWTSLVGTVSFEMFGHYVGVVSDLEGHLDAVARRHADALGLP